MLPPCGTTIPSWDSQQQGEGCVLLYLWLQQDEAEELQEAVADEEQQGF
jgi:hypothetical protein